MLRLLAAIAAACCSAAFAGSLASFVDINHTVAFPARYSNNATLGTRTITTLCRKLDVDTCDPWVYDSTTGQAQVLKQLDNTGSIGPYVTRGAYVYFLVLDGNTTLWRTDGTTAGTIALWAVSGNSAHPVLKAGTSLLYFIGPNDRLWRIDGTVGGNYSFVGGVSDFAVDGDAVYISADTGDGAGVELFHSDPGFAGAVRVKDINPGADGSNPSRLAVIGGKLFFWATSTTGASPVPWVSDGTDVGTVPLETITSTQHSRFVDFGGKAYYLSNDGTNGSFRSSDGTPGGTGQLLQWSTGTSYFDFTDFVIAGPCLYFMAGADLMRSDGTQVGTVTVANGDPGFPPSGFVVVGSDLYFNDEPGIRRVSAGASAPVTVASGVMDTMQGAFGDHIGLLYYSSSPSKAAARLMDPSGNVSVLALAPGQPTSGSNCDSDAGVLGRFVLFGADDGTHGCELWKSDGTAAGTSMVKDISLGFGYGTLFFNGFVEAGGRLYFRLSRSIFLSHMELWRTDGTAAGTTKVMDLGAYGPPFSMVRFGQSLVFTDGVSLWRVDPSSSTPVLVADGTALGYQSIRSIVAVDDGYFYQATLNAGSAPRLMKYGSASGAITTVGAIDTASSAPLGSRMVFTRYGSGVWVTDGTTTTQIMSTVYSADLVMGSTGNRVFFLDQQQIYSTDGTAAGTVAVSGPAPDLNFTKYVVTPGALWYGDGAGGLYRVTESNPVAVKIFQGSYPGNLTPVRRGISFVNGFGELWMSEGTAASTTPQGTFTPSNQMSPSPYFALPRGLMMFDTNAEPILVPGRRVVASRDLDGDARSDLLWRNSASGEGAWIMRGVEADSTAGLSAGAGFDIKLTGDFNGDGLEDVLYRGADGSYKIQLMDGTTVLGEKVILAGGTGWEVMAKGDFNGDGKTDLLWKSANGVYGMWLMDGTNVLGAGLFQSPGVGWDVQLIADFGADGKSDILWRNTDGRIQEWAMDGANSTGQVTMTSYQNQWMPLFAGDFDGDGKADIVWSYPDGSIAVWLVDGTTVRSATVLSGANSGWTVKLVGDLDGDGKADIVLQHTSGMVGAWLMNGASIAAGGAFGPGGYAPFAMGDFNGDGRADVVWRASDGRYAISLMDGLAPLSTTQILGAGTGWQVIAP